MILKLSYGLLVVGVVAALWLTWLEHQPHQVQSPEPEGEACTMEAKMCPDGTAVGRTGPNCEFAACPPVTDDRLKDIEAKRDLIRLTSPAPFAEITSPVTLTGEARGYWFFEASFPVVIVNWDGLIVGEGIATADGEWMTEEFVPFTAEITFKNDLPAGAQDFMKNGSLILQKDNPSGLPEHDNALEVPITFK